MVENGRLSRWKKWSYLNKKCTSKPSFEDEGYLDANSFILVLIIYRKCLLSQFSSRGKGMHFVILTELQNGHISRSKNSQILIKNVLLELILQDKGPLYGNC